MRGPFCTYEKTAIAAEYSKLLGLEEVEAVLLLARLPISEYIQQYVLLDKNDLPVGRLGVALFSGSVS